MSLTPEERRRIYDSAAWVPGCQCALHGRGEGEGERRRAWCTGVPVWLCFIMWGMLNVERGGTAAERSGTVKHLFYSRVSRMILGWPRCSTSQISTIRVLESDSRIA